MARFASDVNIEQLKTTSKVKNTGLSTSQWVRTYDEWRAARNINERLEETSEQTLNLYLERFFAELEWGPALGLFGINLELD
jgi:hypothetical protein